VLPLYWWFPTSTSIGCSPPATVAAKGRAPAKPATVVVEEKAAVVAPEEPVVVMAPEVVVSPPVGLRRDECRCGGDVGRTHLCRRGVGRGGGTEQKRAGDGACAHCACC